MKKFESQFEIVKPHRLVWRLENTPSAVAERPPSAVAERPAITETSRTPDVSSQEKPKKQIKFWEKQLSHQGKELWKEVKNDFEKYQKTFIKDAKGSLFHRSLVTTGDNAKVYGSFADVFIYRIDQAKLSCLQRIVGMDRMFEAQKTSANEVKREEIEAQYQDSVQDLRQEIQNQLQGIATEFTATTEGFGKGVIDTDAELALLKQNLNVLKDRELAALIVKLSETGKLEANDYELILKSLTELMGQKNDASRLDRAMDSVRHIEVAGKTAILNLMTPAQRFKLGELLVQKANQNESFSKKQARQGLLTLSGMGFLDIGQVNALVTRLGSLLKPEEEKEVREMHKMIKQVRRKMERSMKRGGSGNWVEKHLTGSNALIYEIFGRIGVLGAVLPFILNIFHPEQWQHIMADPVWMGCVALGATSVDHITGGIGQGKVTKLIRKIGEKAEQETTNEREKRLIEKLDTMIGNFSEIFRFFKKILPKLNSKATSYDDANPGKRYQFKLADLADANGVLPPEFKVIAENGLSGLSPNETEEMINNFFSPFRYDLGLADTSDMEEVLAGSKERRGLTAAPSSATA